MLIAPPVLPPSAAPAPARRVRRRLAVAVVLGALVLAGCSTSHEPKDYNADIEANFLEACKTANEDKKDMPDATAFCECSWKALRENFTYAEFKSLDQTLRDRTGDDQNAPQSAKDIEGINAEYVTLVEGCRVSGPTTS